MGVPERSSSNSLVFRHDSYFLVQSIQTTEYRGSFIDISMILFPTISHPVLKAFWTVASIFWLQSVGSWHHPDASLRTGAWLAEATGVCVD